MSDGYYKCSCDIEKFNVLLEVKEGCFKGENDFYYYSGSFLVLEDVLKISAIIKNKKTGTENEIISTSKFNDKKFILNIEIDYEEINLSVEKIENYDRLKNVD